MRPSERHDLITQLLSNQEMVTIPELMQKFDISIETARRDLNSLEKEKRIKKVYGGAVLYGRAGRIVAGSQRMAENSSEKEAIGRRCAELVHDGDSIFLGPGTTVLQVAKHLKNRKNLTVFTCSLYATMELLDSDATIFFFGGQINKEDAHTEMFLDDSWNYFCPTTAIISASGVCSRFGLTDYNSSTSHMIRQTLSKASNILLVADNSKFGQVYPCISCPIHDVSRIITGAAQRERILEDFSTLSHRFLFVDDYIPSLSSAETNNG